MYCILHFIVAWNRTRQYENELLKTLKTFRTIIVIGNIREQWALRQLLTPRGIEIPSKYRSEGYVGNSLWLCNMAPTRESQETDGRTDKLLWSARKTNDPCKSRARLNLGDCSALENIRRTYRTNVKVLRAFKHIRATAGSFWWRKLNRDRNEPITDVYTNGK